MEILIKNIKYLENAIDLFLDIPEKLIGSELSFRIIKRQANVEIYKHKQVFDSHIGLVNIAAEDFANRTLFHPEEVWDLRVSTEKEDVTVLKGASLSEKTHYLEKQWQGLAWKPYWTKDEQLAFYARYHKDVKAVEVKDVYATRDRLWLKLDACAIVQGDTMVQPTYSEQSTAYFILPIETFSFDQEGRAKTPLTVAVPTEDGKWLTAKSTGNIQTHGEIEVTVTSSADSCMLMLNKPRKTVSVIGSCVSRDNFNSHFNAGYKQDFQFLQLQNQVSIISAVAEPLVINKEDISQLGTWEQNNLLSECRKDFFTTSELANTDYLILDFFSDVYFGVCLLKDSTLTNNHWVLHKTDVYQNDLTICTLSEDDEAYFDMWKQAVHQLFEKLSITMPLTKVVLHKARFTDRYLKEDGTVAYFENADRVEQFNKWWDRFDHYVEKNFDVISINVSQEKLLSHENHKWGKFNVHYIDSYYHEFLEKFKHALEIGHS